MQGCARAPLQEQKQSMRRVTPPSHIQDDLPLDSLFKAIETEVKYLEALPAPLEFNFGEEHFSQAEYLNSLRNVVELGKASTRPESFYEGIKSEFDFYEVYGQESWGEVFITSYFEPIIKGSLRKTESFSTPLYKTPKDIISLDLALFDKKYETDRKLRGRLFNGSILPYYNREDIDSKFALQGKDLEICWVDPLDAFILQIQGSGTVDLGDGRLLFDIGGAIQGGGRVDLFWGAGEQSKRYSGVMKARGALYYLVPKRTAQAR
ncbi:unnamed protein product [Sphagnum tenellum]